jgi:hypothetical protein
MCGDVGRWADVMGRHNEAHRGSFFLLFGVVLSQERTEKDRDRQRKSERERQRQTEKE